MELLIALTAAVLLIGVSMGIYRHVIHGQTDLYGRKRDVFRRIELTHLLNQILLHRTGPVYGTRDSLAMISGLNLLDYGRELIYVGGVEKEKSPFLTLRVVPLVFAEAGSDAQAVQDFYENRDMSFPFGWEEEIRGLRPEFSFRYGGHIMERLFGKEPESIKIALNKDDVHAWSVAMAWQ